MLRMPIHIQLLQCRSNSRVYQVINSILCFYLSSMLMNFQIKNLSKCWYQNLNDIRLTKTFCCCCCCLFCFVFVFVLIRFVFLVKMTGKNVRTTACNYFIAESSALSDWKKKSWGNGNHPLLGRRGLIFAHCK